MSEQFTSKRIGSIPAHILTTKKYKTNHIAFYIRQPLVEEDYTKVALIPSILKRGTKRHSTAQEIRHALDDLYGASFSVDVFKRGEEQIVAFRLQIANEKFLKDQTPLFAEGARLLSEVISQPLLEQGVFKEAYVKLEKDILSRKLSQIKDDKTRYANKRCVEEMFQAENFRLFANGSEEQLATLTATDLYTYYQDMLRVRPMELFVVGDVEDDEVLEAFSTNMSLPDQELQPLSPTLSSYRVEQEREVIERTKMAQSKLNIGCRTNTTYADSDYIALVVCNGIFGGYAHSKLFRNVREKESLAYYVSSSIESHKGLMMIMSGIDHNNYEQTVTIIKEQLQMMKQGEITSEEMTQTKAVLINQIKESTDQAFQTIDRYFHGVIAGKQRSTEEVITAIEQVSVADVQKVAQKIEIDTIYFLTDEHKEG